MDNSKNDKKYFSRSALADKLGITLKELTQQLIESGWLLHTDNNDWQLTAKGKFEGGIVRESKKYGQYIAWPESVLKHPALLELLHSHINSSQLGKQFDIPAKWINRLLADIGWIQPFAKGWQLTDEGKVYGGVQQNHDSGVPYVVWPRSITQKIILDKTINCFLGGVEIKSDHDLLTVQYSSLDGRLFSMRKMVHIANYLYLLGIIYATNRQYTLPSEETLEVDFYLPKYQLYIFYQPADVPPNQLKKQLFRQEQAKNSQLKFIEVNDQDIESLDQVLTKKLLAFNISL